VNLIFFKGMVIK